MRRLFTAILGVGAGLQAACSALTWPYFDLYDTWDHEFKEELVFRGVVRGLWRYGSEENVERLTRISVGASASEAASFANRYQVRVGIEVNAFMFKAFKVVPLPEGWTYSLDKVIDDGRTVNVGDIVDIRSTIGSRIVPMVAIIRKCDDVPLPGENREWQLACKSYDSFGPHGYAGEVDALTGY